MVVHSDQSMSYKLLEDKPMPGLLQMPKRQGSPSIKRSLSAGLSQKDAASLGASRFPDKDLEEVTSVPEGEWERWSNDTGSSIIFPAGPKKTLWDILMLGLILYSCVTVPFRIGMEADAVGYVLYFEIFVSLAFCTDLVLNFSTAYLDGDVYMVSRR